MYEQLCVTDPPQLSSVMTQQAPKPWAQDPDKKTIFIVHENHDIAIAMSSSRADPVLG